MYYAVDGAVTDICHMVYDNSMRVQAITNLEMKADYLYAADATVSTGLVMNVAGMPVLERIVDWDYTNNRYSSIGYRLNDTDVFNYSYTYEDGLDRISRMQMMDGSYIQYGYDDKSRLVSAGKYDSTGLGYPGEQYSYEYDEIGNLLAGGPKSSAGEPRYSFTANSFNLHVERVWGNQLEIAGTALSNAAVTINEQPVDRQGGLFRGVVQVDNATGSVSSNIVVVAVYNDGVKDIVAQASGSICFPKQVEAVDSSLRGFVDQDSIWDHEFNGVDWLTSSMSTFGVNVAYDYYPDARRARKRVYNGSTLLTTHEYHYDRWNLICEKITDHQTLTTTIKEYTWGLDLSGQRTGKMGQAAGGIGGLLAIQVSGFSPQPFTRTYLPITDHNGNIHHLVDANTKEIVANYIYSPFGVLTGESGPAKDACPFRFSSKYYDKETQLYYYGYRYYDARTAKWLSRDPKGESGGVNLTAFCANDPVNKVDPLGLKAVGRNFTGPLEWMDWRTEYTQAQVDEVYAMLQERDRHVYSPGLANSLEYQADNQKLLERILGLAVTRVPNISANELGSRMTDSKSKFVRAVGSIADGAGTLLDWAYAPVNKIPLIRRLSPTSMKTYKAYRCALDEVADVQGAKFYAWMHSEGAIHGSIAVKNLIDEGNRRKFEGYTFGGGTASFGAKASVRHHANMSKDRYFFGVFKTDPVSTIPAGSWYQKKKYIKHSGVTQVVTPYQPATDENYVHGFPTYGYHAILPEAIAYFSREAAKYFSQK